MYYKEALALEAQMLINYLVDEIVMYDDKIEIFFNKPTRNSPDESRGYFVYKGRKENFDIECETSHTGDSEGIERHLEAPINLGENRIKKEEPKTNNRQCLVFVLGSYWRRQRDSNPRGLAPKRFSRFLQRFGFTDFSRNLVDLEL